MFPKPPMLYNQNTMASHRELSKLSTDLNTAPSSSRPSKNSRGILHVSLHTTGNNFTQPDQPSTPKNTPLPRRVPKDNSPEQDSALATPPSQASVENFTPCVRQNNTFVDPSGNPLQSGTVNIYPINYHSLYQTMAKFIISHVVVSNNYTSLTPVNINF